MFLRDKKAVAPDYPGTGVIFDRNKLKKFLILEEKINWINKIMKSEKISFGYYQNQEIFQYILENDNGMVVKIMNYGATITSISIPPGDNSRIDLVCGFDTLEGYSFEEYKANAPYFGCTAGRYAGRIKDGKFEVDGREYKLVQNDGTNHLQAF